MGVSTGRKVRRVYSLRLMYGRQCDSGCESAGGFVAWQRAARKVWRRRAEGEARGDSGRTAPDGEAGGEVARLVASQSRVRDPVAPPPTKAERVKVREQVDGLVDSSVACLGMLGFGEGCLFLDLEVPFEQ